MIKVFERLASGSLVKNSNSLLVLSSVRSVQTLPDRIIDQTRKSELGKKLKSSGVVDDDEPKILEKNESNRDYKFIYPDFLPNPIYYFRDKIREKLERQEMIQRRKQITIPEFYVGSIMAVTVSDLHAPGKLNRFVGICIRRDEYGLRHSFTLRNVIDGSGVEIIYDLYNPTIQKIEVLKLEKRLDDNLSYLQDCPPEYSTVPFDFEPVRINPDESVYVNKQKVPLNPKPWRHRWDRKDLKGVIMPRIKRYEYEEYLKSHSDHKPHLRWDLMKHYRQNIHDDDQTDIVQDLMHYEKEVKLKDEITLASKKLVKRRQIPKDSQR